MSAEQVQEINPVFVAESWLEKNTNLTVSCRQSLAGILPGLLSRFNKDRKTTIGISGAPGSGKSTLARVLTHSLNQRGIPTCLFSLDDYYLDRAQREMLAEQVHPLMRQRGVPGTHELDRLLADLRLIQAGQIHNLRLPVFDKSVDDRKGRQHWRSLDHDPLIIVFEGWFLGAPPQEASDLTNPANDVEREQDPDGSWRLEVHQSWNQYFDALKGRLDQVWYIRVPDWESVINWRWQQERELAVPNLKSRSGVENFLGCFERIVRHMQDSYTNWADLVMELDHHHEISLQKASGKTS